MNFSFLLCCIKLRLEDLDWKISYVQHNKLSTSKHYYLFLTFCNLEAWFLFTQSKIEDIALFETDITEKITSFITTSIPPFSEISILTVYVVSTQMSLFKFQICLFKNGFSVIYCIPGGWYVLICFICKPEYLHCVLSIFLEPLFWPSANVQKDLQMTNSSLLLLTKKADSKPILSPARYIFYQHDIIISLSYSFCAWCIFKC